MKRRVKIAISLVVLVVTWLARAASRLAGRPVQRGLVILYYHAVPRAHARRFAGQMAQLARHARVVPADTTDAALRAVPGPARQAVAITFDDALDSVFDHALPVLDSQDFPSTIFVPLGWMGAVPAWEMEAACTADERVASADRLRRTPRQLVAFGSHTVTHPHLPRLDAGALQDEIARSRDGLSRVLDRPVDLLAFPYGEFDTPVLAACRSAGYRHVFTIEPHPVRPGRDDWMRGRVAVEPHDGPLEFYLKAMGAYRWMPFVSALKAGRPARAS